MGGDIETKELDGIANQIRSPPICYSLIRRINPSMNVPRVIANDSVKIIYYSVGQKSDQTAKISAVRYIERAQLPRG